MVKVKRNLVIIVLVLIATQVNAIPALWAETENNSKRHLIESSILPQSDLDPEIIILNLHIRNDNRRSLCIQASDIPEFSVNYRNLFPIIDVRTGEKLKFVGRMWSGPFRVDDRYIIIPPGYDRQVFMYLHKRFNFIKGEHVYSLSYEFPGYFCEIFRYGYPGTVDQNILDEFRVIFYTGEVKFRYDRSTGKFAGVNKQ